MGREEVMEVLKDKDLNANEIKRDLEKNLTADYNIELIRNCLLRSQKHGLIEKVNEKKEFVYKSVVNKSFKVLEQIELTNVPKELKISIYEFIITLLPSYLKAQLNKVIKDKNQEIKNGTYIKSEKDFEKLKSLYI